jgi:uncharacterized membrane-anchored protein YjiN (DUF445 family)
MTNPQSIAAAQPLTNDDPSKLAQLNTMKRRATGLLVFFSVVFAAASAFEDRYAWVGYLRALAEAAMIGGIADWFAITALFRQPLGLPIPHTAIIPQRKDRIGRSLGGFVQNNFLSREVISTRLHSVRIAERGARWVSSPEHARSIARHVANSLSSASAVMRDDDVRDLIDRSVVARARQTQVAPIIGNVLGLLTAGNRHQELLDRALGLVARLVDENDALIRTKIKEETPWWLPNVVDDKIHDKFVSGIERTLSEVSADPEHPLRRRFDVALAEFIEKLKTSPETIAQAEALKEEVLAHPAVRQFSASLWDDLKASVGRYADRPADAPPGALERGLNSFGATVLEDPVLLEKIDSWVVDAALYVVDQYRDEVGQLITHTVGQWDPEATSRKIELQIGKDLQFVRINGTVVGGLVGLLLYTFGQLF